MLIVQKYGGTSVADTARIFAAAARAAKLAQRGDQVVMVVSAQGDTTDDLIRSAVAVNARSCPREMDAYMAAGEQLSAGLMAMALMTLGYSAISLTGWQAGIATDQEYGNARIVGLTSDRIQKELAAGKIVVVAGFQGIGPNGDITTLGRGGSDTTAVALAAYLKADRCQIFTDVDGVYDKDPHRYPGAVKYDCICYEDMLDLIQKGAQVLHDRSVELAREHGIKVEVLSSFTGKNGTIVG